MLVDIRIDGNFSKLESEISKIEGQLNMLNVPLRELEDTLKKIYEIKFRNFDRFRDRLSPGYRKWKDQKGLPVGVKTGKTKKALTQGDSATINRVVPFLKGGFVYEYGLHADSFVDRRGYPKSFDAWLQKNGDDLIGLDITEAEFLMDELTVHVNKMLNISLA
jgi:hypothetical protein